MLLYLDRVYYIKIVIYKNKFEWSANRTEFRQPLWVNDKVTENKWNNIIAMFTNDMHKNVTPRH